MNLEQAHEINLQLHALLHQHVSIAAPVNVDYLKQFSLLDLLHSRILVEAENAANARKAIPARFNVLGDKDIAALFVFLHFKSSRADEPRPFFVCNGEALAKVALTIDDVIEEDVPLTEETGHAD